MYGLGGGITLLVNGFESLKTLATSFSLPLPPPPLPPTLSFFHPFVFLLLDVSTQLPALDYKAYLLLYFPTITE